MELAGRHLIIDAYYGNNKLSYDINYINQILVEISEIADMTIAVPPITLKYPVDSLFYKTIEDLNINNDLKNKVISNLKLRDNGKLGGNGVSGTAIWVESHLTIHTWSDNKFLSLDMYSCKDFNIQKVTEYLKKELKIIKASCVDIKRYKDQLPSIKIKGINNDR